MNALTFTRDAGLQKAIDAAGSVAELARRIGLHRQAVSIWRRCPAERAKAVHAATGVPLHKLRPDLWSASARS